MNTLKGEKTILCIIFFEIIRRENKNCFELCVQNNKHIQLKTIKHAFHQMKETFNNFLLICYFEFLTILNT